MTAVTAENGGGDCILIPGAEDAAMAPKPDKVCGTKAGLPTAADMAEKTVCCKLFLQSRKKL